jgi:hypothetical protein
LTTFGDVRRDASRSRDIAQGTAKGCKEKMLILEGQEFQESGLGQKASKDQQTLFADMIPPMTKFPL